MSRTVVAMKMGEHVPYGYRRDLRAQRPSENRKQKTQNTKLLLPPQTNQPRVREKQKVSPSVSQSVMMQTNQPTNPTAPTHPPAYRPPNTHTHTHQGVIPSQKVLPLAHTLNNEHPANERTNEPPPTQPTNKAKRKSQPFQAPKAKPDLRQSQCTKAQLELGFRHVVVSSAAARPLLVVVFGGWVG